MSEHGGDAEQAARAYEDALAEVGFLGRHASPEDETGQLHALRTQLLRLVDALPSTSWPRRRCEHCGGRREVAAVHAQYGTGSAPEFVPSRQRCPLCWGTGLALKLPPMARRGDVDDT